MVASISYSGTIPEFYDRFLGPLLFQPYAMDLASRTCQGSADHVLEIACGSGLVTRQLIRKLPSWSELIASDINPDMIATAKERVKEEHIDWLVADRQDLPFRESSFDLVVCQFGFMFMPEKGRAFKEAARVLKPDGRLLFNVWDRIENNPLIDLADKTVRGFFPVDPPSFYQVPFSFYDVGTIQELLDAAGFRNTKIELVKEQSFSPTARDAATGIVDGIPVSTYIQKCNPALLDVIRNRVEKEIARLFGSNPLRAPMAAWVGDTWKYPVN